MMEIVPPNYVPELEFEDLSFFHQYPMAMDSLSCPFDNFDFNFDNNYETAPNCLPLETHPDDHYVAQTRPTKKIKTLSDTEQAGDYLIVSNRRPTSYSSPQLISFEHYNATSVVSCELYDLDYSDVKPKLQKGCNVNKEIAANYNIRVNQTRNTIQAKEHVVAERKRREKLTRSFIALSAIVPGLKKMDKASVLGDAITYMKKLQARLHTLEAQAEDNKKTGSAIHVKRSVIFTDNHDDDNINSNNQTLPEIEVRVSRKDVLIKIQCDKHKGRASTSTVLGKLESLNLTVQSSNLLPFGNNIVDLTIVAQMNEENCVKAKELLGSIRHALIINNN
ncbi:transcription factor bHLH18-like [Vicia villosa]|uniref:transcription factor bHLH18-like n=1 Tax=Vicia villosa TaxID=3911 RepID=UPI00273AF5A7|nr:transcription factor bHLH18-like [Vicia villosa]